MDNPFAGLEPQDGYRVVEVSQRPQEVSLHVVLYMHGKPGDSHQFWSAKKPALIDEGKKARLAMFGEALCRYFNAGGTWQELYEAQWALEPNVVGVLPEDCYLLDCYIDTEGNPTYVWYHTKTHQVTKWAKDFIETYPWHQHLAELRSEDATDQSARIYPPATGLPGGADSEEAAGDDHGDRPALPGPDAEG